MHPTLFNIGQMTIHTANIFYIFSWFVFSFLFWRFLRGEGMLEERIFDLTFYGTVIGLIAARLGFVFLYPQLFSGSILLVGAFWVQGGLWAYAGLFGMLAAMYLLSRRFSLLFSQILDAFVISLPWALVPLLLGLFFQGNEVGIMSSLPWAIRIPGVDGVRHPIQLYEMVALFILGMIAFFLRRRSVEKKWPDGLLGVSVLALLCPVLFALEFLKQSSIYLYGISANQWVLIGIFAESLGTIIIKKKVVINIKQRFTRGGTYVKQSSAHIHSEHEEDSRETEKRDTSEN